MSDPSIHITSTRGKEVHGGHARMKILASFCFKARQGKRPSGYVKKFQMLRSVRVWGSRYLKICRRVRSISGDQL